MHLRGYGQLFCTPVTAQLLAAQHTPPEQLPGCWHPTEQSAPPQLTSPAHEVADSHVMSHCFAWQLIVPWHVPALEQATRQASPPHRIGPSQPKLQYISQLFAARQSMPRGATAPQISHESPVGQVTFEAHPAGAPGAPQSTTHVSPVQRPTPASSQSRAHEIAPVPPPDPDVAASPPAPPDPALPLTGPLAPPAPAPL